MKGEKDYTDPKQNELIPNSPPNEEDLGGQDFNDLIPGASERRTSRSIDLETLEEELAESEAQDVELVPGKLKLEKAEGYGLIIVKDGSSVGDLGILTSEDIAAIRGYLKKH